MPAGGGFAAHGSGPVIFTLESMITLSRFIAFALGAALTVAPSFLLLQFAYGVGEPPDEGSLAFFIPTILIGLVLGLGPLLIGIPKLVAGPRTPTYQLLAGVLLAVSIGCILLFVGFNGTVTRVVSPVVLVVEVALFALFIWPAKLFFANASLQQDRPQAAPPQATTLEE